MGNAELGRCFCEASLPGHGQKGKQIIHLSALHLCLVLISRAYWTGQIRETLQGGQFVGSVLVNIMSGAQDTSAGKDIITLMGKVARQRTDGDRIRLYEGITLR